MDRVKLREGKHYCYTLGSFSITLYIMSGGTDKVLLQVQTVLLLMSTMDYFWHRAIFLFIKRLEYLAGHDGA